MATEFDLAVTLTVREFLSASTKFYFPNPHAGAPKMSAAIVSANIYLTVLWLEQTAGVKDPESGLIESDTDPKSCFKIRNLN